jgi:hypothetical protein
VLLNVEAREGADVLCSRPSCFGSQHGGLTRSALRLELSQICFKPLKLLFHLSPPRHWRLERSLQNGGLKSKNLGCELCAE